MANVQRIKDLMVRGDIATVRSVSEAKAGLTTLVREAAQRQVRLLIHRYLIPSAVLLGVEDFTNLLAKAEAYDMMKAQQLDGEHSTRN